MRIALKYGCNPHQTPAGVTVPEEAGFAVLSGRPGYINFLDALGAWQLVRELKAATGKPGAASFKHVSPAGAAVAGPLSDTYRASQFLGDADYSPVATAYARARGGDRMCSFGDVAAVSDVVDMSLARLLFDEVSDLIIAPGFEADALELLKTKRDGAYMVLRIDPAYEPADTETREVFGFTMTQKRNTALVAKDLFTRAGGDRAGAEARGASGDAGGTGAEAGGAIPDDVLETLVVATIALKYTQSNSVCIAHQGQVIGMGAGQQSRVHCTRLACGKADKWLLQQHPKTMALAIKAGLPKPERANLVDYFLLWDELSDVEKGKLRAGLDADPDPITREERADWGQRFDGICLSSDAFIPFPDNLDRAAKTNVRYVAQTGGSARDDVVTAAAEEYGMTMVHTGLRLFLH
jgi:phosphoribosylaminoimidazolecarboxamide formyltransferase / IMP cyclohydrolase